MGDEKIIDITCSCGTEILRLQKDDNEIYLSMYKYGKHGNFRNWWGRVKYCFNILLGGKVYTDQMVLNDDEMKKLKKFINNL